MLLEEKISELINDVIVSFEFRLVQVKFFNSTLQIMVEPLDEEQEMNVEDCAKISRAVSALLDVEDLIKNAYSLEVSSPGLARPLVIIEDYDRFQGQLAKISTRELIDDRRRFNGRLKGTRDGRYIEMDTGHGPISIPFDAVESAKLDPSEWFLKPLKNRKKG